jgi:chromosomal replication initiation ATPase DnaA
MILSLTLQCTSTEAEEVVRYLGSKFRQKITEHKGMQALYRESIAIDHDKLIMIRSVLMERLGIDLTELVDKSRKRDLVAARHIYCKLCWDYTLSPLYSIATMLGGLDHSSIIHGIKTADNDLKTDAEFRFKYELIHAVIADMYETTVR